MYSLETERLILRPFIKEDVTFLNYLHSDLDVMRYTLGRTRSELENIAYVKVMMDLHEQMLGHLVVIRKEDMTAIGRSGFSYFYGIHDNGMDWFYWGSQDKVTREGDIFKLLELGYTYAKPFWGQGYATEAAVALKEYGYKFLGYTDFSSLVIKENTPSVAVARKMGAANMVDCMMHDTPSFNLKNVKNGNLRNVKNG